MLNWINNQGVQSDEGWIFQRAHRFGYHYTEDDHFLEIGVESGEVFFPKDLIWNPPFDGELIAKEKRAEVRSRVLEAMRFMGSKYRFTEL